jgi:hypothetical protein
MEMPTHLKKLSELFSIWIVLKFCNCNRFNGLLSFNLHVFKALLKWKKTTMVPLEQWLMLLAKWKCSTV